MSAGFITLQGLWLSYSLYPMIAIFVSLLSYFCHIINLITIE